jgi:hypothetical protein
MDRRDRGGLAKSEWRTQAQESISFRVILSKDFDYDSPTASSIRKGCQATVELEGQRSAQLSRDQPDRVKTGFLHAVNHGALKPPETGDPIDLSPLAQVGGDQCSIQPAQNGPIEGRDRIGASAVSYVLP